MPPAHPAHATGAWVRTAPAPAAPHSTGLQAQSSRQGKPGKGVQAAGPGPSNQQPSGTSPPTRRVIRQMKGSKGWPLSKPWRLEPGRTSHGYYPTGAEAALDLTGR